MDQAIFPIESWGYFIAMLVYWRVSFKSFNPWSQILQGYVLIETWNIAPTFSLPKTLAILDSMGCRLVWISTGYPPEAEQFAPEKWPKPNRKVIFRNHHFSGAMLNFGAVFW